MFIYTCIVCYHIDMFKPNTVPIVLINSLGYDVMVLFQEEVSSFRSRRRRGGDDEEQEVSQLQNVQS